jgi:hypothetical protein
MQKFLLSVFLGILSVSGFSQEFEGGFLGGLTASQIDGDLFSGYNKVGITAGAYTTRKINNSVNWKLEIRYTQKGSYQKYTETNPVMYKTSLHYAEVPFLLQYFYNRRVFLEAGLIPEILLYSKEENESGVVPEDQSLPFHRFSLEACAGIGFFLTDQIAAGFRYSYSLFTARDHASGQTYLLNRGQYNNVLSFTIYYHFR